MRITYEMMVKAKAAKKAEELLDMAKANGITITQEESQRFFNALNRQGELSDDELDAVAGGKNIEFQFYDID